MTSSPILKAFALSGLLAIGEACSGDKQSPSSQIDSPSERTDSSAAIASRAPGVGTWVSRPVDDVPSIEIRLLSTGEVQWDSGFAVFGPARWTYDSAAQYIAVSMPTLEREDLAGFADNAERGHILRFDSATRTVYIAFAPESTRFFFAGYYFDRQPSKTPTDARQ